MSIYPRDGLNIDKQAPSAARVIFLLILGIVLFSSAGGALLVIVLHMARTKVIRTPVPHKHSIRNFDECYHPVTPNPKSVLMLREAEKNCGSQEGPAKLRNLSNDHAVLFVSGEPLGEQAPKELLRLLFPDVKLLE